MLEAAKAVYVKAGFLRFGHGFRIGVWSFVYGVCGLVFRV